MSKKSFCNPSLFCILATSFMAFACGQSRGEEVCTAEGCHHLESSVKIATQDRQALFSALEKVEPRLAKEIRAKFHCELCPDQEVLDPYCLVEVSINPESRVKVDAGQASRRLAAGKWNTYLVKVVNLAGVTSPLRVHCDQAKLPGDASHDSDNRHRWLSVKIAEQSPLPTKLTGDKLQYCLLQLHTDVIGKRTAVLAMDVGQGTADIGFRNDVVLTFQCSAQNKQKEETARLSTVGTAASESEPISFRRPDTEADLQYWLKNMVWQHNYTVADIRQATGLSRQEINAALAKFRITRENKPKRNNEKLMLAPYPGGKHPRIGFLEGAIAPQRETKASVFAPWDNSSYVVLDVPEAIWSNLGLTYLAHTHIPTLWDQQDVSLDQLEWKRRSDGSLECERELPNGIVFGTKLVPEANAIRMEMWLSNGTTETLTNLRVQNCTLLKFATGFDEQTNDNKLFWGPYAACRNQAGDRWIISAWEPVQRAWGNADCPCLHSDPQFPDCEPGETQRIRGWLSFYEGTNAFREILRIERSGWRHQSRSDSQGISIQGVVFDEKTQQPVPARVHVKNASEEWFLVDSVGGEAVHYDRQQPNLPDSPEVHTTLSADPFLVHLQPGDYTFRVERGKEYVPVTKRVTVDSSPLQLEFPMHRWIDMASRGWYSGDTHVHRTLEELPNVMLAEDLNVALPLTYWVTQSDVAPVDANGESQRIQHGLIEVDPTHVIYPTNTEYEIFSVGSKSHTLGAIFVLNHEEPLTTSAPPVSPVARLAHNQGALLDLDKHSWPWSLMLVPTMNVELFQLANNHVWQTSFGFKDWTLNTPPAYMSIERDEEGFTEWGWINYGFQTYYSLLNCGFRMRVSAGTASGVHPVQLGFGRVYVHLPRGFDYEQWIEGLDGGHSFVSTGPMLDLRFNGKSAGTTYHRGLDEDSKIRVTGTAESRRPLQRIEIVVNGKVEITLVPHNEVGPSGAYVTKIDEAIQHDSSYWVAVRCFEEHPAGRVRFAHTNPVFLEIADRPLRPRKAEIAYFIRRMEEEIENSRHVLGPEALAEYQQALSIYRTIAENAR